ncbi:hypothetical protein E4P42_04265 [Mycobacterium sp. PS03-16]|uniref:DUF6498-containing protein n=1 Tax=Mycobacterium sp. PS03-16 TaxID=2559611 RepID=UPI00107306B2|nr:DUF6498-containing protein [Mycobacterium sp. PS03-16]TFV60702.1 hypothetical protein E4P42_04265 [Mycobacterium sp. PS03-16]
MRKIHGLIQVAVIAVPGVGWFLADWSAGTTLVVYWFETFAGCLLIGLRIAVHQRVSPRRGHFRYRAPASGRGNRRNSFLRGFLTASLVFTAAHGVFLAVLLVLLDHNGEGRLAAVDGRSVASGCALVLLFLLVDACVDLPRLRNWSFHALEQTTQRGLTRIGVVHFTLVFGLLGVAVTGAPSTFFGVFVALRTLYSLSIVVPQWDPATPPAWFSRIMNRIPNAHPGERFEEYWARDRDAEAARRRHNEEPWRTGPTRPGSRDRAAP